VTTLTGADLAGTDLPQRLQKLEGLLARAGPACHPRHLLMAAINQGLREVLLAMLDAEVGGLLGSKGLGAGGVKGRRRVALVERLRRLGQALSGLHETMLTYFPGQHPDVQAVEAESRMVNEALEALESAPPRGSPPRRREAHDPAMEGAEERRRSDLVQPGEVIVPPTSLVEIVDVAVVCPVDHPAG
jgi:hypothetical protein